MITAAQLRAARALLAMDQRALAHAAQLSLPTIQRMEGSDGVIRGTVDSLMKLIAALQAAGVELINDGDASVAGGRGVRVPGPTGSERRRTPKRRRDTSAHRALPRSRDKHGRLAVASIDLNGRELQVVISHEAREGSATKITKNDKLRVVRDLRG